MAKNFNKRKVGHAFETKAVEYLTKNGYQIIKRNFYSTYGELDIIAKEKNTLVFIEVKGRNSLKFGNPEESISPKKIQSLIKTAEYFLYTHPDIEFDEIRFDIISIIKNNIKHIKNAFSLE